MELKTKEFLRALETVKPGLANKEIIEQSTSFAFEGNSVVTYNDEISIRCFLPGMDIEGVVKADSLYRLVERLTGENLNIVLTDNELLLKAGKTKAGLTLTKDVKLPLGETRTDHGNWEGIPEDFSEGLKLAVESCGHNSSEPKLMCVHVRKDGIIEGSDGFRIVRYFQKDEMSVENFMIPATSAKEVAKIKPDLIKLSKSWAQFKNTETNTIISCRTFGSDTYPETEFYFQMEGVEVKLPEAMSEAMGRASVFAKQEHLLDEVVTITLEKGKVVLESRREDGWFKEVIDSEYKDEPISFMITPYLLKNIVRMSTTCTMDESRLRFEGENWIYIAALKAQNG